MRLGLEDTGPPLPAEALERFEYVVEAKAGTRTLTRKASRLAADPLRPGAMPAAMWGRTLVGGHLSPNAVFFPHVTDALVILLLGGRRTFLAIAASIRRRFSCDIRSPS
jgi:hypothetical protein